MIIKRNLDEVTIEHYNPPLWKKLFLWPFPTYTYQVQKGTGVYIQKFVIAFGGLYSYGTLILTANLDTLSAREIDVLYSTKTGGNA